MYEQSEAASVKKDTNIFKLFIMRLFFTTIANINNETDQKSLFSRSLLLEQSSKSKEQRGAVDRID